MNYLHTGEYQWTMTAYAHFQSGVNLAAFESAIMNDGTFSSIRMANTCGIRPVINLKSDVLVKGDGSESNPFKVI